MLNNWGPRGYNGGGGSTMREEKKPDRNRKEYNGRLVQRGDTPCSGELERDGRRSLRG